MYPVMVFIRVKLPLMVPKTALSNPTPLFMAATLEKRLGMLPFRQRLPLMPPTLKSRLLLLLPTLERHPPLQRKLLSQIQGHLQTCAQNNETLCKTNQM